MSSWLSFALSPSLPEYCVPENEFLNRISSVFHICIPTNLAFISVALGNLSILSWLFAQLPQIYKNYCLQSTSGLSIYFLIEWCLGDSTNLVGAFLTNQATWQQVVAFYYVCVDCVLVSQYVWYTHWKDYPEKEIDGETLDGRRHEGYDGEVIEGISASEESSEDSASSSDDSDVKSVDQKHSAKPHKDQFNASNSTSFASLPPWKEKSPLQSLFTLKEKTPFTTRPTIIRPQRSSLSLLPTSQTLFVASVLCLALANASPLHQPQALQTAASHDKSETIGRILSWISTILYLGSRLPQIYKNYSRKSTAGLSPSLFIAAFFGNLFYSSSILTNPQAWYDFPPHGGGGWVGDGGSERWEWVKLAIPFWLGAAGVLALDGTVGAQFLIYGEGAPDGEGRGRKRWRQVQGWMRGWVPSVSPSSKDKARSEERPLLEDTERSRNGNTHVDRQYGGI
ncbi:MAG: hypothetical protein MMC33_004705 [Icmadophila ericetorum]|nr:hypothetical protein [Icmadophila ericetorum]